MQPKRQKQYEQVSTMIRKCGVFPLLSVALVVWGLPYLEIESGWPSPRDKTEVSAEPLGD